jgi:ABC-type glycerol-3-phosphate transport system permease component
MTAYGWCRTEFRGPTRLVALPAAVITMPAQVLIVLLPGC